MFRRPSLTVLIVPALLLGAGPAAGIDTGNGTLTVNAFGSVGYGRTGGNAYGAGTKGGDYDNTTLALSVMGRPSDKLIVGGQLDFTGEEVEVDWAFAEWKVNDALRLRVGKAKHPFGSYGEIPDIGTLRPFFNLPTSVYGPAHLVGDGYVGAGLNGFVRLAKGWSLGYDVYGGELHAISYEAFEQLLDPSAIPGKLEMTETRELLGGRVTVETPIEGLGFGASAYTGTEKDEIIGVKRHTAVALSVEYLTGPISARAECAALEESKEADTQAAYLELAYKFAMGLQLAARVEGSWATADAFTGSSALLRHQEAAVGVNYWFSPDLVVKASYHLVDGNRFAFSETRTVATGFDETTHLIVAGAQFSF